jgi:hypothetical protein
LVPVLASLLLFAGPISMAGPWQHQDYAISPATGGPDSAESAHRFCSLTVEETIRRFFDARLDPTERRVFSYRMADAGTAGYPQA